ncbi:MAG: hypothetical protein EA359_14555 [Balneolaceae bacterium]|nr:MAG: hypothetical protein EA359_14555 [Balneolaceae bacterium]
MNKPKVLQLNTAAFILNPAIRTLSFPYFMKPAFTFLISLSLALLIISSGSTQERFLEIDSYVETDDYVTVHGERIPYRAKAGTQPVWGEDGKPLASLFYVYYRRTGYVFWCERRY